MMSICHTPFCRATFLPHPVLRPKGVLYRESHSDAHPYLCSSKCIPFMDMHTSIYTSTPILYRGRRFSSFCCPSFSPADISEWPKEGDSRSLPEGVRRFDSCCRHFTFLFFSEVSRRSCLVKMHARRGTRTLSLSHVHCI